MTDSTLPAVAGFAGQPVVELERDGVHYTLLGTAHVSKTSIDAVMAAIDSGRFDAVAVELDEQRHKALTNPDALAQLDLIKVIRERKVAPFAANLALAAYQRSLTIAMALVFAIPAIASIVMGFKVKPTGANEAIARTHIAFRRRAKAAGAFSLVAMICVTVALTYGVAQTQKVVTLSPPEDYSLADGVATIKFSQISDGHLHRFEYRAKDGTSMRFIIIKKNGGAYGVGLDACDNCGDAGYYEKDGKIICKKCDVAINLATIGFKGGCNPIPFDYQVKPGKIVIQTSTLDALSSHFQ